MTLYKAAIMASRGWIVTIDGDNMLAICASPSGAIYFYNLEG